jgi:tetratricopeptide (TPR) repeat protein
LQPYTRDRNLNLHVLMNLAHCYAMKGEWDEAIRIHQSALEDAEFPETPNSAWFKRVEKDYYRRWLQLRRQAVRKPVPPALEPMPDLFQGPPPADAIAVVQQLLLWCPDDNGLFWLLADLYAKADQPRVALHIYNSLASGDRAHWSRTLMMKERTRVAALVATLPPEAEPEIPVDPPDLRPAWERLGISTLQLVLAGTVFAIVAGVLLYFQIRKLLRRRR